jgi:hypothetical protein
MLDVVADAEALPQASQDALPAFFWWSRKGGARTSEIGLVTAGGLRWKILATTCMTPSTEFPSCP